MWIVYGLIGIAACLVGYRLYLYRDHNFLFSTYIFRLIGLLIVLAASSYALQQTGNSQGQQIEALLDVSASMGVQDIDQHSRLSAAKQLLSDVRTNLPTSKRGVTIFAGAPQGVLPITDRLDLFTGVLAQIDARTSTLPAGSDLYTALRYGIQRFDQQTTTQKILLLLTDGGEQEATIPDELKKQFADRNVQLIIVGMGTAQGGPIPIDGGKTKQRSGHEVISTLNSSTLQQLATAIAGRYLSYDATAGNKLQTLLAPSSGPITLLYLLIFCITFGIILHEFIMLHHRK